MSSSFRNATSTANCRWNSATSPTTTRTPSAVLTASIGSSWSSLGQDDTRGFSSTPRSGASFYLPHYCDLVSVEQIAAWNCSTYRVASRDLTNWPLLEALAQFDRPIILSTGMASEQYLDEAVSLISRHHNKIVILQCTSEYPCPPAHVNLRRHADLSPAVWTAGGYVGPYGWRHAGGCRRCARSMLRRKTHYASLAPCAARIHAGSLELEGLRRLVSYIRQIEEAMEMAPLVTDLDEYARTEAGEEPVFQAGYRKR